MGTPKTKPEELRSHRWFGVHDMRSFSHRARTLQMGYRREEFVGRPVIGIINTWSDLNPCHHHLRERAEDVKRGVWQAGGYPVELPALSLGEVMVKPTAMLYRNLLALEVEELLRSHPLDGAVLLGGCDKTGPALMMGAISVDLPVIFMPAGSLLRGNFQGQFVGSGVDTWRYWDELRAGTITKDEWFGVEAGMARSFGHCNTMGTASTMTAIIEALGFTLPGATSILASDSNHVRMASACGNRIVEMVWQDLRPSDILTRKSVENALTVMASMAGSTNAVIHLTAMAKRAGLAISLEDFHEAAARTPVLANIRPSGTYLMEDFYYAGGLLGLMSRLTDRLHLDQRTVAGTDWADLLAGARIFNEDVIRPLDRPVSDQPPLVVLNGNLSLPGAIIKPSAASPHLMKHTGRAVVFKNYPDMMARLDDPATEIDKESVLVLQNAGPKGGPGMPEWGMLPVPKRLLQQGIRDMVRISDARMSGTSYGTCVLHVTPESAVGGPLALVRDGDLIELDVAARKLWLHVPEDELERRRAEWTPPPKRYERSYGALYQEHILQADQGCDFDFLQTEGHRPVAEPEIF